MKLSLHRAEQFNADFDQQHRWYLEQAGEELATRFLKAVEATLQSLLTQPDLGRTATELSAERLMHGARDLPRRLVETLP